MEKRCSQRTPSKLKILLFKKGLPVAIGRASNVSEEGAFVHTDYTSLAPSQPVEIEFLSGTTRKRRGNNKQLAVVTRMDAMGVALRFDQRISVNVHRGLNPGNSTVENRVP